MPMPPFESRSAGLPEVPMVAPGWTKFDYQNPAETFLSAYMAMTQVNSKRQQLENQMQRLQLENERINNQRDLGEAKLGLQMQGMGLKSQLDEAKIEQMGHSMETADQRIKLSTEAVTFNEKIKQADSDRKQQDLQRKIDEFNQKDLGYKTKRDEFSKELENRGIPLSAFDQPIVHDTPRHFWQSDPKPNAWKLDPEDPNMLHIKVHSKDDPAGHDVPMTMGEYQRLKSTHRYLYDNPESRPETKFKQPAGTTSWTRDPATGKLIPVPQ